jgi:hypothetical protein
MLKWSIPTSGAAGLEALPVIDAIHRRTAWLERVTIAALTTGYLLVFNMNLPHGDALRIVRQIESSHLSWNPNHLYLDPLGYGWFRLLENLGVSITPLGSFEIISAAATVAALLIFHALLLEVGVTHWGVRALALAGLFASKVFLSLAISQYYFMLQMPFILGALFFAIRLVIDDLDPARRARCLYGIGICSAVATMIMFSNVFLVAGLSLIAGLSHREGKTFNTANVLRLCAAAAAVGLPAFIIGHLASDTNDPFFRWLTSYQGDSGAATNTLYGMEWTPKGIAISLARAAFTLVPAIAIEMAGMGTAIRAIISREPLEFVPETWKLLLAFSLTPIVAGVMLWLFGWAARRLTFDRFAQLSLVWIGAFVTFNVLWSSSEPHFWIQVVPVPWLMLLVYLGLAARISDEPADQKRWWRRPIAWVAALSVAALLIVNTVQSAIPVAWVDVETRQAHHTSLLRDGDLEIVPGWDAYGLMESNSEGPQVDRLALMNMALEKPDSPRHISRLPALVADRFSRGNRVIAARLYDKDHDVNPWVGLARLGWPRTRIQALLDNYCHTPIGTVDDAVVREVRSCAR